MSTSKPVYKVEVWEPGGGSALYTFNTGELALVSSKEIITSAISTFSFTIPTKYGPTYKYYDIDLFDTIKIWYGYDTVPASPTFIGKVGKILGTGITGGYLRKISGFSLSEILQRRFKSNYFWNATDASTIATDLATDLGINDAADIDADTNHITLEVQTKSYFDLLREISDYWYDSTHKVQKDFWVDTDNDLKWKARPVRTVGVETLTIGTNIEDYTVTRQIDPVKNSVTVYGEPGEIGDPAGKWDRGRKEPTDGDSWTHDADARWHCITGSVNSEAVIVQVGASSTRMQGAADAGGLTINIHRDADGSDTYHPKIITYGNAKYLTLNMWYYCNAACATPKIRLHAPDAGNYFEYHPALDLAVAWHWFRAELGEQMEYDASKNPNGLWDRSGSPNWKLINSVWFYDHTGLVGPQYWYIDGLYFGHGRWRSSASDTTSISTYGQRDLEIIDDRLVSDGDCNKRAETMVLMCKDPPTQIDLTTVGNTNILPGDRLAMTIPAENISAINYDVVAVEHSFTVDGFKTKVSMVNSANTRQLLETDALKMVASLKREVRQLATDFKRVA